jgi:hypothetical protein
MTDEQKKKRPPPRPHGTETSKSPQTERTASPADRWGPPADEDPGVAHRGSPPARPLPPFLLCRSARNNPQSPSALRSIVRLRFSAASSRASSGVGGGRSCRDGRFPARAGGTRPRVAAHRRAGSRRQGELSPSRPRLLRRALGRGGEGMPRVGFGGSSCEAGFSASPLGRLCGDLFPVVVLLFFSVSHEFV